MLYKQARSWLLLPESNYSLSYLFGKVLFLRFNGMNKPQKFYLSGSNLQACY